MMQENIIESAGDAQVRKNRLKQQVSVRIHADTMSASELNEKLEAGYTDMIEARVQDASLAFEKFKDEHIS